MEVVSCPDPFLHLIEIVHSSRLGGSFPNHKIMYKLLGMARTRNKERFNFLELMTPEWRARLDGVTWEAALAFV